MKDIIYIDRVTGQKRLEKIYKGKALHLLYGDTWSGRLVRPLFLSLFSKWPFFSILYGKLQKRGSSVKKVVPFIKKFDVDPTEFLLPVTAFTSFNDFFVRKLKIEARPIAPGKDVAVIPADGRYFFYQDISQSDGFVVKGKKFRLTDLLQDPILAAKYEGGSMVIARLCPSDYHRFHFPCDCIPSSPRLINGCYYSVNPIAIKKNLEIFTQNKRVLSELKSENFGKILYLEIGATNVGSIKGTATPDTFQAKGAEKGYFEFGGSSLILLFSRGSIQFDEDLLQTTKAGYEIRCLMGQRMGHSPK
ncbi:MAG: phosphatidylserine decarboxylase [Candidatus Protochlamydia sp.]|nr:phosphatidylserine decarboxylase [Candidatus Protochlamydia sp.]